MDSFPSLPMMTSHVPVASDTTTFGLRSMVIATFLMDSLEKAHHCTPSTTVGTPAVSTMGYPCATMGIT